MFKAPVQTAPFIEHPISNDLIITPNEYDVITYGDLSPNFLLNNKFNLEQYCACLLHKLFSLTKSKIKPFLKYQCEQLDDPFTWLNKLEKLIDLNRELFITKEQNIKIEKTLMIIELLRQEIENNKFNKPSRFDFTKVQKKAQSYNTTEEKLSYLHEAKTEYLQNKPRLIDTNEVPFDEKIDLEINLLKTKNKLSRKKEPLKNQTNKSPLGPLKKSPQSPVKFKINTNLNQFVDVFFQLIHEKKTNGIPCLEATPNELAEMIAAWFNDKEGKEISIETIKTILKPSRFEKRPKGNARIDII